MSNFAAWLTNHQALSPITARAYASDLGMFAAWYQATNGEPLNGAFTSTDVREYRAHLLTVRRAKPATINRALAAIRQYGAWLVATGQLDHNPAAAARGVAEQRAAPKWLDGKQAARLMREAERAQLAARTDAQRREAARNLAIITVLLHTGVRLAELCALELADVQIGERSGSSLHVRAGKGEKARSVPLNLTARRALAAWYALRPESDCPAVFLADDGAGLQRGGVQRVIGRLARRAGVEATPHTLRHTFAKSLIDAGASEHQVAALLGHTRVDTTRLYTVPGERDLAAAVGRLED